MKIFDVWASWALLFSPLLKRHSVAALTRPVRMNYVTKYWTGNDAPQFLGSSWKIPSAGNASRRAQASAQNMPKQLTPAKERLQLSADALDAE